MGSVCRQIVIVGLAFLVSPGLVFAQASISGRALDEQQGLIPGATVTVRQLETNATRTIVTNDTGRYHFPNLPVGTYELTVELSGFSKLVRTGVRLALNQDAVMDVTLQPATLAEQITVRADSPILNTTSPEVGVRWDTTRVAELPVGNSRSVVSLALSAAGVSQLGSGQSTFAGTDSSFSVNGARVRSNNFMLDGQDSNDPSVSGLTQPINNTDVVQEVRLITNQFGAEFGRSAGAVMNIVTKSGTNAYRGSAFVFHNNNEVNARSNLDKAAGRSEAPYRHETQYGGTIGGRLIRDKTFFFGSYQRWTDRRLGAGTTLNGAPTAAGRAVLQSAAGDLPQVQALLKHLPVADAPIGRSVTFVRNGQTYSVDQGSLTGSADVLLNNHQPMARIDHQLGRNHKLCGRYLYNKRFTSGVDAQVTPPGLLHTNAQSQHATNIWLTSTLGARTANEFRVAHQYFASDTQPVDPVSLEIPSIEVSPLGLTGFNAAVSRTAIGLGVNFPQFRFNDTYQIQNTTTYVTGTHTLKAGADIRHIWVKSFFVPTIRGLLRYGTMQQFIDDTPEAFQLNSPLPGGQSINYYTWNDYFFFAQDEWRIRPDLTLNLGLRYELAGNTIEPLVELNEQILAANNNDERFRLTPVPEDDTNNFQPRVGFNWNPRTSRGGPIGWLTGGDKFVLRGGFARTHDQAFLNMALNVATAFPFIGAVNAPGLPNAFARLPAIAADPTSVVSNVNLLARTTLAEDLRMPYMNQVQPRDPACARRAPLAAGGIRRHAGARPVPVARSESDGNRAAGERQLRQSDDTTGSDARRHPRALEHSVVQLSFAADEPRETLERRAQRRRPLHLEQVHRHDLRGVQPVEWRGRGGAGSVQRRKRQSGVRLRSPASLLDQRGVGSTVAPRSGRGRGQASRRVAGQRSADAPERRAVHGAEWRRRGERAGRKSRRQRHSPEHQTRIWKPTRCRSRSSSRPVERRCSARSSPGCIGSVTSAATRSAPTGSAISIWGSSRTRACLAGRTCRSVSRCSTPRTRATLASPKGASTIPGS